MELPPYSFVLKEDTYLVSNGCGLVYLYNNYNFARIDRSFPHRNQYSASPFIFNDEIYLFGGYGLFSNKNFITKYNKDIGEWTQVQITGEDSPHPRHKAFHFADENNFYVFGGITQNPEKVREDIKVTDGIVWKLHLPTMEWSKAGKYDPNLFGNNPYKTFQTKDKLYILFENIYEIDLTNNIIKTYAFKEWKQIKQIIFDSKTENVVYTYWNTNTKDYTVISEPLLSFLGKQKNKDSFFKSSFSSSFLGSTALLLIVIVGSIAYKRNRFKSQKSKLIYNKKEEKFYHKKKIVSNLDDNEFRLLQHLILHKNSFIPLNELNQLFQIEKDDNFSVITKRREVNMSNLLFKLSSLLNIPKENILIERRNPTDRRLKEVKLSQGIFKVK